MWQQQPDQQLAYSAARMWARRHAPDLMLGIWSPEEFDEAAPQSARPTPGRHANGQENRFYREPRHDQHTGEVVEDPAEENEGKNFATLRDAMRRISSASALLEWARANAVRMNKLPVDRLNDLRRFYSARMAQLRPQTEAAE